MIVQNPFVVGVTTVLVTSCWTRVTASIHQDAENSLLGDWMNNTESGYTVAQRLRHTASASLMHFPLVFKTVSDQADSVSVLSDSGGQDRGSGGEQSQAHPELLSELDRAGPEPGPGHPGGDARPAGAGPAPAGGRRDAFPG